MCLEHLVRWKEVVGGDLEACTSMEFGGNGGEGNLVHGGLKMGPTRLREKGRKVAEKWPKTIGNESGHDRVDTTSGQSITGWLRLKTGLTSA